MSLLVILVKSLSPPTSYRRSGRQHVQEKTLLGGPTQRLSIINLKVQESTSLLSGGWDLSFDTTLNVLNYV